MRYARSLLVYGLIVSGILLPMLGVSTARAEPSHYPEPVDTATFPANEDPLTFEIRYLLRPDGWLLDPNLLGSGVVVWKETASGRERVLSVGVQGLCQPPIEAECRPANEWITERFTVGSTNEAFFLRIVGTQSIFCDWDPGPCPFGDPRPHMNPALYAIDSPGIGGYLRICDGGDPPNCPDPTPDQCDAESGPIGNRELVVAGTYAGTEPRECPILIQRSGQPGSPPYPIGELSNVAILGALGDEFRFGARTRGFGLRLH